MNVVRLLAAIVVAALLIVSLDVALCNPSCIAPQLKPQSDAAKMGSNATVVDVSSPNGEEPPPRSSSGGKRRDQPDVVPPEQMMSEKRCGDAKIVFGLIAGAKFLDTRVTAALRTWLRDETTVVFLEDESLSPGITERVEKLLLDPQSEVRAVNTNFTIAYLNMTASDVSAVRLHPAQNNGAWKVLQMLPVMWERHPDAEFFTVVDDDTYMFAHNLRYWLCTGGRAAQPAGGSPEAAEGEMPATDAASNAGDGANVTSSVQPPTDFWRNESSGMFKTNEPLYTGCLQHFSEKRHLQLLKMVPRLRRDRRFVMSGGITFVHGGSGLVMNRHAMRLLSMKNFCIDQCLMFGGDWRLGCCARLLRFHPRHDTHFFPPHPHELLFCDDKKFHLTSGYPVGLHHFRRDEFTFAFDKAVSDLVAEQRLSCRGVTGLKPGEGSCVPLRWPDLLKRLREPPFSKKYPPHLIEDVFMPGNKKAGRCTSR